MVGLKNLKVVEGITPLMAVFQVNKDKLRPVINFRELNSYMGSHTAKARCVTRSVESRNSLERN